MVCERGVERGFADFDPRRRFANRKTLSEQNLSAAEFFLRYDGFASALATAHRGCFEAGAGSFPYEIAFELPECAPKIWKTSLPPGVEVSIASVSERKLTPRASRAFTVSIRCGNDRPRRSSFHTVRISPWRTKHSAAANPGRSALAPDALSSKMRAQPALA